MADLEFAKEVAEVVRSIPKGKVLTYGDVAALAVPPSHARQAGPHLIGMIFMNRPETIRSRGDRSSDVSSLRRLLYFRR